MITKTELADKLNDSYSSFSCNRQLKSWQDVSAAILDLQQLLSREGIQCSVHCDSRRRALIKLHDAPDLFDATSKLWFELKYESNFSRYVKGLRVEIFGGRFYWLRSDGTWNANNIIKAIKNNWKKAEAAKIYQEQHALLKAELEAAHAANARRVEAEHGVTAQDRQVRLLNSCEAQVTVTVPVSELGDFLQWLEDKGHRNP